jgi:hypothetical protein
MKIPELAFVEMKPIEPIRPTIVLRGATHEVEMKGWRGILEDFDGEGVGIDPGRNFGLGIVRGHTLTIYGGRLPSRDKPFNFLSGLDAFLLSGRFADVRGLSVVIEGASYEEEVGQVLLAEIRAGFFIGMHYFNGSETILVPPTKVRKTIWGHGSFKGTHAWPLIDPNGADAGACALYAAGYKYRGGYSEQEFE